MRRLPLALALTLALLVVFALPAGADPGNGNSATVLDLNCGGEDITVLVMFNTGSVAVFGNPDDDTHGREYVISSVEGEIFLTGDPVPVGSYAKTWPERRGYGDPIECEEASVDYTLPQGDFTEVFTVSIQSK